MTPQPDPTAASRSSCVVSTQALCWGQMDTSVFAVAGAATRPGGRAHIGIKYGRLIFYVEDRAALDSLADAVTRAVEMSSAVFGPRTDAFTEAETKGRRRFERTGDTSALG